MRKVTVSLPEGLYRASIEIAKKQGHLSKNSTGLSALCRGLLRARCSKEGYSTTYLDSDDENPVPAGRNGIRTTGENAPGALQRCPYCGLYFCEGEGHYCIGKIHYLATPEAWTKGEENNHG